MKIILNASRCRHCEYIIFCDNDGNDLEHPMCLVTGYDVGDDDSCKKFSLCKDVKKELFETLGFKSEEIELT